MLPVEHILPSLHKQLIDGDAIVVAPPGAGKSTCLPLSLLKLDVFKDKKIILLQPRRIAVRNIATYLSSQLGEAVGQTIGYRIRGEVKVSTNTRLEIVTEGVLTRMLQNQPELPDVGLVIFDEFHERSVHADFSLALCIEVQQALRGDLRLLVMSATLDVEALIGLLPAAKLLESKGKSHAIDIVYQADNSSLHLFEKVSRLVIQVFPKHQHDCLVFLPGAYDINKAAERLSQYFANEVEVLKLFSELSKNEQQRALLPHPAGKRKIVLATNIAETSLTIEGIELVVDSGVEKRAVFQLSRGISHLQIQKISRASATQRAGRAGRLGPGTCYRLWSEEQHGRLMGQSPAEILQIDISGFVLESAVWGTPIHNLALIDQPTEGQLSQAYEYLTQLALLDSKQRITPHGSKAHKLGCQAGVANMIQKSIALSAGHLSLACALTALLESKDPLGLKDGAQLSLRIELLQKQPSHSIWHAIRYWHKRLGCSISVWPIEDIGLLLAAGFPQWVGYRSHSQRYLLANGSGVQLNSNDPLAFNQWIIVASMLSTDKVQGDVKVVLAEPLSRSQLDASFDKKIAWHTVVRWDESKQLVTAEQHQKLGRIVIANRNLPKVKSDELGDVWRQVITDKGVMNLPFEEQALQLIYRIRLAKKELPNFPWPDVTERGLLTRLDEWLMPYLSDVFSWQQLSKLSFVKIISADMEWSSQTKLNEFFPRSVKVPSGSYIKLMYFQTCKVKLSVRIQEVYGLADTIKIANGQIVLQMELLSPAGRPIQTTQDLAGFWQGSYKAVQKEMKGRYQKHFWPDDPATAIATTRTKKKMNNNTA